MLNDSTTTSPSFPFENSYARLPERFFERLPPTPVAEPGLIRLNNALADHLGLDSESLTAPTGIEVLAGNRLPAGAEPLAMAYAGFQFGNWVPQLGDGRAILLGEVIDRDGVRRDIQLKGAGPTPFSRRGDGRAALGPVLREFVLGEAMAALGVATTRSLAAVTTGERVVRETHLPGAVLTRVAQSHIRVGTFQFFAARQDLDAIQLLADHVIARHYPEAAESADPHLALLQAVTNRQAELIASWQLIGFIHGVMNTDNTSVAGETIDYGPCAFMDHYHPETVYSSIDQRGRYAYCNQPHIAQWNLAGFAESLLPLMGEDQDAAVARATEVIQSFSERFNAAQNSGWRRKLGLARTQPKDTELVEDLLARMADNHADFTSTFRSLCDVESTSSERDESIRRLFDDPAAIDEWMARWRQRLQFETRSDEDRGQAMRAVNPAFIPRNHLVEEVISAAVDQGDFSPFHRLVDVTASPYGDPSGHEQFTVPPRPDQVVHQTFCGT
ncbi:YdiU family protein [Myxococcota bacterium]|nr:YdiU family protein [Myxococcota bacterium]